MPLLGKKSFKPNPLPKDLRSAEEVFVIKETNEVFRSYDEYVNRIILYGFQVWGCQLTGKTNLKYGEAVASEEHALRRLESFPKYLEKPILQLVHHNTCTLQTLVQQCYKSLEKEYVENEPVECYVSGKWHQGRISRIHHQTITENKTDVKYDIECENMQDCLKVVPSGDIKRLKKLPSEEMVSCFIRANTENPWRNDNSPWIVKTEVAKKYSLGKLNDFSLVSSKPSMPSSKNPTKSNKSNEKPKKNALDQSAGHGKPGVNKTNLSQRKLDSFTKSIGNSNVTVSLSKLSDKSLDKFTPAKKGIVNTCSSSEKGDGKTPSSQLRGTPVKCRLVLTPIKSPYSGGISRSPAHRKSGVNDGGNKTKKTVVIEDDTNDVIITSCKSPKVNSGKKITKSPKSGKAQKTLGGTEDSNKKKLKGGTVSKKLDLLKSVTADNVKEKEHIKGAGSKDTKTPKSESFVQKGELLNVDSDSDKDFESSPRKLAIKPKQSSGKMKQMTLLDLTKKPDDQDTVLSLSPKMKAKKQKTLSEMFSAAIPKDKPINQLMNALTSKTAQQVSSSSCPTICLNQALVAEKSNTDKERLQRILNKKLEDNKILNSKPLPLAKPVNMPSGITAETFGDVAMIADFVYTFRDLLVPRESLHISIDNLSQALVAGKEGFPLLSRILFIFLQILLQDRSTKGEELGMQLSEMPLTQQSASEVSRLYLNSKFKILTSYEDDKQLQRILESLQHKDFYNLTPEEKTKILVILCHEVLSSDAMDDYFGSRLTEATELRKQKKAKQKSKNEKKREEKERRKKEKEERQKRKEEEENKKQLKVDELNNKETEMSNKTVEKKLTNAKMEIPAKEQSKEVSEVVKTMRKRREDMAGKDEKKLKEEKERLEKKEEEEWKINMAQCLYTVRLNPIGCDRNHARYWVFNGAAAGVFVEQGWWNLDNFSRTAEDPSKESREVGGDSDIEMVEQTTEVENKMGSFAKVKEQEWRFPDISYEWLCYSTVEEIQTLIDHLSHQGIRESALKKSLKEKLTAITDGINRRNASRKPTKPETGEQGVFSSIKEELKNTAERLVCGNLAVLHEGVEEYQHTVDQASTISDLASQLEKLLPAVLPQFHQGLFSKDKKDSEKAKQHWLDKVIQATTVSRLHLLLEILDSTIIWDLSAENARCKICCHKGIGTTLILCDDCNVGYHLQCLRPALSEVPEGHWSCLACKPNERKCRTTAKNYKDESGSEIDDEEGPGEASIDDSDESSEDESDEHEDYCHTCGEEENLICCDTCPLVFHKDCHQPPLRHIPRGAWSCWQCRQPKNKKQKENQRGGQKKRSKKAKNKVTKSDRRDGSSLRSSKLKRPHSRSSDESGSETVSKRTRQSRQPIEIVDGKSARDRRRNARACIEDMSDDESADGKMKSKTTQSTGKVVRNGRTSSRLQRILLQDSDDENEENKESKSNAKSFYGKSTGRALRQKISSQEEEDVTNKRCTNASRNSGRGSLRNRPQVLVDSEDEEVKDEEAESGKENLQSSLHKTGSRSKSSQRPARKSTRNQRQALSSPEESEVGDEDTSHNTSSSFEESEESGHDTSKRQALRTTSHAANKANKVTATRKTRARLGDKTSGDRTDHDKVKSNSKRNDGKEKGKKGELRNSSTTKDKQMPARDTRRTEVLQEETKRRRVNVEMDACVQIIRDLLLHEDSWPFTQAVNLREVPDYLELITTPMDLGTIKEKLNTLQYPDVDSFVSDVRLVFTNSDKYNLRTSDVGQAGKNLEKYFDKLFKENLSNTVKKTKVQRKR